MCPFQPCVDPFEACSGISRNAVPTLLPKAPPGFQKQRQQRHLCGAGGGGASPGAILEPGPGSLGAKKVHLRCSVVSRDASMECVARAGYRVGAVLWEAHSSTADLIYGEFDRFGRGFCVPGCPGLVPWPGLCSVVPWLFHDAVRGRANSQCSTILSVVL